MVAEENAGKGRAARLCLTDGTTFEGVALGAVGRLASGPVLGEAVFTTGMTGYEEILTDPSYRGQIVTMTAPQIGNTGTNDEDGESVSGAPHAAALIVRDASGSGFVIVNCTLRDVDGATETVSRPRATVGGGAAVVAIAIGVDAASLIAERP